MALHKLEFLEIVGRQMLKLRKHLNYSCGEMSRKLGLSGSGYYKNENGITFPRVDTLDLLQRDFDISMDWLIFNKGPMLYGERHPEKRDEKEFLNLEKLSSHVRELLEYMERDPLLQHEVLVHFYKYKERKGHQGSVSEEVTR